MRATGGLVLVWATLGCSPAHEPVTAPRPLSSAASVASTAVAATASAEASAKPDGPARTEFPEPWACPLLDTQVEVLAELKGATALTATDDGLQWTDGTKLFESPLDGGAATVLSRAPTGSTPIVDLAARKDLVLLSARRMLGLPCIGGLFAFDKTTKTVSTIKDTCVNSFSVSDTTIAYAVRVVVQASYVQGRAESFDRKTKATTVLFENLLELSGVAVGGDWVYMSHSTGRFLKRRADGAGTVEALAANSNIPADFLYGDERYIAADATGIYAFAAGSGSGQKIFRVLGDEDRITQIGADPEDTATQEQSPAGRFAESARHLYWAAPGDGEVRRVDRTGKCGMEIVAKGRPNPRWVSFGKGAAYWLEDGPKGPIVARRSVQ